MKKRNLILVGISVLMIGLSAYFLQPTEVILEGVDYTKYHDMLTVFSKEERSLNTTYHDLMHDYLVEQLEQRGLTVQLLDSAEEEVIYTQGGEIFEHGVSNIYATLPATVQTEETKNIVFASHYDSVEASYGAADAGLPVISFFAGLDAILDQERVNDISILITDHEELGLVGANYVMDNYPEIVEGIDYLYNWEARGTSGNMILFETSENDYQGVKNYIEVTDQRFAASIATAVYSQMPNGSDFTTFMEAGISGMNFAMVEGFANYHTSLDHIDNIPMETFNYYVNNVVQVMSNHATQPFAIENTQRSIYFNFFDASIIFPEWFVLASIVLTTLGAVAIIGGFIAKKQLKIKQFGWSLITVIAGFVAANILVKIPVGIFGLFSTFKPYQPEAAKIRYTLLYNDVYIIILTILLIAVVGILIWWFNKKKWVTKESLLSTTLLLGCVLQGVLYNILFGSLVLTLVPLIVLELCYFLNRIAKTTGFAVLVVAVLIPVLLPILYYVYIALTVNSAVIYMNLLMVVLVYFMSCWSSVEGK